MNKVYKYQALNAMRAPILINCIAPLSALGSENYLILIFTIFMASLYHM